MWIKSISDNYLIICINKYLIYIYCFNQYFYIYLRKSCDMAKIVTFMNNKGGVGKTITTHSVGIAWAKLGKRVLFIDLDSQANLTAMLSKVDPTDEVVWERTLEDAFIEGPYVKDGLGLPIHHAEGYDNVDFVPSSLELANFDQDTARADFREVLLLDILEKVRDDYDYILLDCPPAIQTLTTNALIAADYLVLVTDLSGKSVKGLEMIMGLYNKVVTNPRMNPNLKLLGVVVTRLERDKVNRGYLAVVTRNYGSYVVQPYIRKSTMVSRALSVNESIYDVDPDGKVAGEYMAVSEELLMRIGSDFTAEV